MDEKFREFIEEFVEKGQHLLHGQRMGQRNNYQMFGQATGGSGRNSGYGGGNYSGGGSQRMGQMFGGWGDRMPMMGQHPMMGGSMGEYPQDGMGYDPRFM